MPSTNPWLLKALAVLEDGDWRDREKVLAVMGPLVPPGRAHREAERQRHRRASPATRTLERSDEFLIASGRRSIVINSLTKCAAVEQRRDPDGRVWVRRRSDAKGA